MPHPELQGAHAHRSSQVVLGFTDVFTAANIGLPERSSFLSGFQFERIISKDTLTQVR